MLPPQLPVEQVSAASGEVSQIIEAITDHNQYGFPQQQTLNSIPAAGHIGNHR